MFCPYNLVVLIRIFYISPNSQQFYLQLSNIYFIVYSTECINSLFNEFSTIRIHENTKLSESKSLIGDMHLLKAAINFLPQMFNNLYIPFRSSSSSCCLHYQFPRYTLSSSFSSCYGYIHFFTIGSGIKDGIVN